MNPKNWCQWGDELEYELLVLGFNSPSQKLSVYYYETSWGDMINKYLKYIEYNSK